MTSMNSSRMVEWRERRVGRDEVCALAHSRAKMCVYCTYTSKHSENYIYIYGEGHTIVYAYIYRTYCTLLTTQHIHSICHSDQTT